MNRTSSVGNMKVGDEEAKQDKKHNEQAGKVTREENTQELT